MNRLARILLVASLMISIGGQWMLLQGVAWVGMAVSYSLEEGSVGSGLSKTFDGEHPCPLCKAVKKASQKEGDSAPQSGKTFGKMKVESFEDQVVSLFPPPSARLAHGVERDAPRACLTLPEVPPPETRA